MIEEVRFNADGLVPVIAQDAQRHDPDAGLGQ